MFLRYIFLEYVTDRIIMKILNNNSNIMITIENKKTKKDRRFVLFVF